MSLDFFCFCFFCGFLSLSKKGLWIDRRAERHKRERQMLTGILITHLCVKNILGKYSMLAVQSCNTVKTVVHNLKKKQYSTK